MGNDDDDVVHRRLGGFRDDEGESDDDYDAIDPTRRPPPPPSSSSPIVSVAIVGGSYSGLVLSNYLRMHSVSHVVYDRRCVPYVNVVDYGGGRSGFDVPSFFDVVRELGLSYSSEYEYDGGGRNVVLTREGVMKVLMRNVMSNHLASTVSIVRVERNAEDGYFYLYPSSSRYSPHTAITDSRAGRDPPSLGITTSSFGPYRIVVGADGVNSVIRQQALRGTYLIGDARWAKDRWYDLGLRRIRRGADVAMNDGVILGRIIVDEEERRRGESSASTNGKTSPSVSSEASACYCARLISERRLHRRRIGCAAAIATFALIIQAFDVFSETRHLAPLSRGYDSLLRGNE